ncbi:hypothetical protein SAMN04488023_16113 [Pedobacter rhizosphaerae]|uniref:Uncharacterized protein n=1 Tax=Pedobacter rhizosphaerae TaxID=390241 RepID=A0A1H9W7S9_9SPHI|nr:hypothetical protein SAMN04488023_16113 [Pedobacter rhizosphaerae]
MLPLTFYVKWLDVRWDAPRYSKLNVRWFDVRWNASVLGTNREFHK